MDNPLLDKIKKQIEFSGPISLAEYFHVCMADPQFGYYKNQQVIGAKADFITAPEISQMFGELIGVWMVDCWKKLGSPKVFSFVELGPGNGTMMADILRAAKVAPDFLNAAKVTLVETSDLMRAKQKEKLNQHSERISWADDISNLPNLPTLLVANEFFDVVPIRQFIKAKSAWRERGIQIDKDGKLTDILLASSIEHSLLPKGHEAEPHGAVFETSPARQAIAQTIAEHIAKQDGAALIIDYGHTKSGFGDTFQAIKVHERSDPFSQPGLADLTSHVDFEALAVASQTEGLSQAKFTTQGEFLLDVGLLARAGSLGANADAKTQETIKDAVERLAGPDQMGELFKVMCLHSNNISPLHFT